MSATVTVTESTAALHKCELSERDGGTLQRVRVHLFSSLLI